MRLSRCAVRITDRWELISELRHSECAALPNRRAESHLLPHSCFLRLQGVYNTVGAPLLPTFLFLKCLFIWLCRALVEACEI